MENKYTNNGNYKNNNFKAELPAGYLKGGYYSNEEKTKLKKEYIIDYAQSIAKILETDGGRDANKRSQIRKFYDYVVRVNTKMQMQGNDFEIVEADLAELLPHVAYAGERRVVSRIFKDFIGKNLEAIHDEKDLRAFTKHFEAVVAYTKKD